MANEITTNSLNLYKKESSLNNIFNDFNINSFNNNILLEQIANEKKSEYQLNDIIDGENYQYLITYDLSAKIYDDLKKNFRNFWTDNIGQTIYNLSAKTISDNIFKFNLDNSYNYSGYKIDTNSLIISNNNNSYNLYYNYKTGLNLLSYNYLLNDCLQYDEKNHFVYLNIDNDYIKSVNNILYYDKNQISVTSSDNYGNSYIDTNILNVENNNIIVNSDYKQEIQNIKNILYHKYNNYKNVYDKASYYLSYYNTYLTNPENCSNFNNIELINLESNLDITEEFEHIYFGQTENQQSGPNKISYKYINYDDYYNGGPGFYYTDNKKIYSEKIIKKIITNSSNNNLILNINNLKLDITEDIDTIYIKNLNNISFKFNEDFENNNIIKNPKLIIDNSTNNYIDLNLSYNNNSYYINCINRSSQSLFQEYGIVIEYSDYNYIEKESEIIDNNTDYSLFDLPKKGRLYSEGNSGNEYNIRYTYNSETVIYIGEPTIHDNQIVSDSSETFDQYFKTAKQNIIINLFHNKKLNILYDNRNIDSILSVNKSIFVESLNKNSYYILSSKNLFGEDLNNTYQALKLNNLYRALNTINKTKCFNLYSYNNSYEFNYYDENNIYNHNTYINEYNRKSNIDDAENYKNNLFYKTIHNKITDNISYITYYPIHPLMIELLEQNNVIVNSYNLHYYKEKNKINNKYSYSYSGILNNMPNKYINDIFFDNLLYDNLIDNNELDNIISDIKYYDKDILYLYELVDYYKNYSNENYNEFTKINEWPKLKVYTTSYQQIFNLSYNLIKHNDSDNDNGFLKNIEYYLPKSSNIESIKDFFNNLNSENFENQINGNIYQNFVNDIIKYSNNYIKF